MRNDNESPRIKMIDIKPCDECEDLMSTHIIMDLNTGESTLLCPDCFETAKIVIENQDCNSENDDASLLYTGGCPEINDKFIKADYERKIEKGE